MFPFPGQAISCYSSADRSSHDPTFHRELEVPMRGKQIVMTAAVALAVVLGVQTYQAKKR